MRLTAVLLVPLLLTGISPTWASAQDGRIVAQAPCAFPPVDSLPDGMRQRVDPRVWARIRENRDPVCTRVTYLSGGLRVTGFVYRPAEAGAGRPALVFNRGGNLEFGRIGLSELLFMRRFAREGFVVAASQYRGNDGGEGREEFGGADVDDVLALFPLLRAQPGVDSERLYVVGHSRGGMMTYLALARGAPVKAAVAWAGPADLEGWARFRPEVEANVLAPLIPGFREGRAEALRERSAIHWPERLRAPLMIVHGTADRAVPAEQSVALAERLKALGAEVELVLYPDDDHALSRSLDAAVARMLGWFRAHGAPSP